MISVTPDKEKTTPDVSEEEECEEGEEEEGEDYVTIKTSFGSSVSWQLSFRK